MNILTAIIIGIDNAGVDAQEKGVPNDGEKITHFSNRRKALKGIQAWRRTLRKECAKEEKKSNLAKPAEQSNCDGFLFIYM